ncbi:DUF6220 domain-containing protein [Mastigocoleus testarum]|uniref:Cytochrome b561 domain-containing protein n=1 Tax=Mastigocoleus testarum BC008 TaxID=371196 RepID=A0A0V7ZVL5_9CYAN|nr:DUF6220 domain-containing protein [Mastigocoleus testarum]KST68239.1 hypothetical protein BC008_00315 [Mastigocoleus testarum BC008]
MDTSSSRSDLVINQTTEQNQSLSKLAAVSFYIIAIFFNFCLITQLLTVGLAYFYNPDWWRIHVWLVRGYGGLSLILMLLAYWFPFSKRVRSLAISLPILLALQFLTIHIQTPLPFPLAIVHPLIGFVLFSASTTLVHHVWQILSPKEEI